MRHYKLEAIIIKSRSFGDADKFYTVFSKEKGKVIVKGRGVKRIKSKLASHLESLNLVSLNIVKGKGKVDIITGAISKKSFKEIKSDLNRIAGAYFYLDVVDKLMVEGQKNEEIFDFLCETLNILNNPIEINEKNYFFNILEASFNYNLIKILGHKPKIDNCIICSKIKPNESSSFIFDFDHGGIICENCYEHKINSKPISFESLKILNAFEKIPLKNVIKIKTNIKNIKETKEILKLFNFYMFQKEYKSKKFTEKTNT